MASKQKREIYGMKIRNFWLDFSHNKVGFFGLVLIVGFVVVAIISPLLTPYEPVSQLRRQPRLADRYAMPVWFKLLPRYRNFNPTVSVTPDLYMATIADESDPSDALEIDLDSLKINFESGTPNQTASVTIDLGTFDYTYARPNSFRMFVSYNMTFRRAGVRVYFIIKNHTAHSSWRDFVYPDKAEMHIGEFRPVPEQWLNLTEVTNNLKMDSFTYSVVQSLFNITDTTQAPPSPGPLVFPGPGTYGIQVRFEFFNVEPFENANAELIFSRAILKLWGRVHGVLGTNFLGNDVWTELVYGTRVSIMVGILSAIAATSLGILYGVVSGYLGGFVDEFLMRVVDVLLCIPVLPILLVMMRYYRPNVYYIVVLIAIFGWQGLSRVIRSRVLSLKELAFIESARASGASDFYLIIRHLIPNVLPIAMSAMVLAVPGAIITEAALSFLGFGDPNAATWGRMLYQSYQLGGLNAWWTWLPPGLAITAICIGFVFMGHAIDEIVNPRLRRRR